MSLNAKKIIKQFFEKYYWRQHPEAALRYLPVVDELKKAKLVDSAILEIGSGSLGITPYLKKEIDGIDKDFSGPQTKLLKKIRGKADILPFKKNTYDVTISVDVVEHLPNDEREKAIFEQLRVTKKLAVIVIPLGSLSEKQDSALQEHWQKIFKTHNQF